LRKAIREGIQWKLLLGCIALPLAAGGLSALLTRNGMEGFGQLNQPPLSPPAWLFPVVWSILYILMGIAAYLVLTGGGSRRETRRAMLLYWVQLLMNVTWPLLFFGLGRYLLALLWLLLLLAAVIATALTFRGISRPAAKLLIPYILWLCFAGYLNLGIYLLN